MHSTILFIFLVFFTRTAYSQQAKDSSQKFEVSFKNVEEVQKEKSLSEDIKDWLIPVSTFITLLTVAIGAYQSLREYRLKLKAEARLAHNTAVEVDIKLMQGFTELLALAHSRKGSYLSEKAVEKIFEHNLFTAEELKNPFLLNSKLEQVAVLNINCGSGEQDAFIAAITNLALKHEILKAPTIQALETMISFKPDVANKYLKIINPKTT